ncbi:hypothetical protein CO726_24780 [Bacillus fungorum]|uniref:DUF2524 domain-containing protein n=1 Tax=Bacillus fungorum TaxID=2039284 RepID=A0A2G6Q7R0_9BACI|nr:hypothetical protein [Bacillus fungorum]PIE92785.1 hypothetical protein CO726_24780 [Bacillus fungorum]
MELVQERKDDLNKKVMDKVQQLQVKFTQERTVELNDEMKQAMEEKIILESFISEQEGTIPDVVLVTLKQKIRRLNSDIKVCEARLKAYK